MNLQDLEEILIEFMQAIQIVMQSGEQISDEFQGQIAQTLELLYNTIETMRYQESVPTPVRPEIPSGRESSNIAGMAYDDKTGNMLVQFLGKYPDRNGPIYQYPDTPKVIAELLQSGAIPARTNGRNKWSKWWKGKVPSAGASVFTLLKERGVPYQRLS